MPNHPDDELDDLDFGGGSYARHDVDGTGRHAGSDILDKMLGTENTVPGTPAEMLARGKTVQPPPMQATNQATMECLRGPCCHLWHMTVRFHAQSDRIHIAGVRQCNNHFEPTDLTEQNVYLCDAWWPRWLLWVPLSVRSVLRRPLRRAWERVLRAKGYDFSWRTWPDDAFEADRPSRRRQGGLGVTPATFANQEGYGALTFNTSPDKQPRA